MQDLFDRAQILAEALPYIRRFRGKTFVIKYGGHAMGSADLAEAFAQDIVLLDLVGINPVVVHGGGPQITDLIDRLGLKSTFVRGMRVTDAPTMEAAEMVLQRINKDLVQSISRQGGRAVGLSGKDADMIVARKMQMIVSDEAGKKSKVDVGLVGDVVEVNVDILRTLDGAGFIPVIAPTGFDREGQTYNINADVAAGKIAGALKAEKLILLSDVEGVKDKEGQLIPTLDPGAGEEAHRARRYSRGHDSQGGMLHRRLTRGRCENAHPRWAGAARRVAGDVHGQWRRHRGYAHRCKGGRIERPRSWSASIDSQVGLLA